LILGLLFGVGLGIIAGLTPGLHINIISVFLLTYSSFFGFLGVEGLIVAIVSMAIVANYFEFIKALLFGLPDIRDIGLLPDDGCWLVCGEAGAQNKLREAEIYCSRFCKLPYICPRSCSWDNCAGFFNSSWTLC
jgi:hypothetical protein